MAPWKNVVLATLLLVPAALAAPVPVEALEVRQLAGEGDACNSILSGTDNAVGYGVENAEDNIAGNVGSAKGGARRRQLAGEGAACSSIFKSTDDGVGYGIENAEDNIANDIKPGSSTGTGGGSGSPPPPPPPPPPHRLARRQGDKIANGAAAIFDAAGLNVVGDPVKTYGDSIDGTLTSGAANAGAQVGQTEESTLENAGSSVPKMMMKRQGDKMANGAAAILDAAGLNVVGDPVKSNGDSIDGTLTSGAANAGAQVGQTEESTLENAGSQVPRK